MLHIKGQKPDPAVPPMTMYQLFCLSCVGHLDDVAIEENETTFTRREMLRDIKGMTQTLVALGVKKGDIIVIKASRVVYMLPVIFLAANAIGAVVSFRDDSVNDEDLKTLIDDFNARILFVIEKDWRWITSFHDRVPNLDHIANLTMVYRPNAFKHTALETVSFYGVTAAEIVETCPPRSILPYNLFGAKDLALIACSSGSTSSAKQIMLSNYNMVAQAIFSKVAADVKMWDKKKHSWMSIVSPEAPYGFQISTMAPLCGGGLVYTTPDFSNETVDYYFRKRPNTVFGVPRLLQQLPLLLSPDTNLSQLYTLACGGESFSVEDSMALREWLDEHGASQAAICNGFGTGEMGGLFSTAVGDRPYDPESVGYVPPGVHVAVLNPETYEELGFGEVGLLCAAGDHCMMGYYKRPKLEHDKTVYIDGERFIITGNFGKIAEDGKVFVMGRDEHFLNDQQLKIYNAIVNAAVQQSPLVKDSQVVKGPDSRYGLAPYVFVVLEDEVEPSEDTKRQILETCGQSFIYGDTVHTLGDYELPHAIEFLKEMPLNDKFKVDLKYLMARAKELGAVEQAIYDEKLRQMSSR